MNKPTPPKSPKKSEMLEVRLSHEDKQALQRKAGSEGRSVSAVVRNLIASYLASPNPRTFNQTFAEFIMTTKSFLIQRPKAALASLALLLVPSVMLAPMAFANDVEFFLDGSITRPEGEGIRTRTFKMQVIADFDKLVVLEVPNSNGQAFSMEIRVTERDGKAVLQMKLVDTVAGEPKTIAMPTLTAVYGESARVEISKEDMSSYALSISPQETLDVNPGLSPG